MTFTISYTGAKNDISVDWATADGTAVAGSDYVASSGTATFTLAGPTSQTITIPVIGDLLDEANETFTVNLTNAQPRAIADITTATGTGTITDNDPLPSVVINDVSLTEGNSGTTNADFTITLSAPSGRNVTVNYATANATATQPADYTTTSGTLTFTPGQVTKTVSVPVVGDAIDEIDETFVVNLTVPVNVTIADNQGVGTITDDDPLPSLTINDVSLVEGNAGTSNLTFTATLSAASGKTVTVDYATADATATSPADYTNAAGTLSFAPGVITRTFTVPVVGDTLDEFDETFAANLSNPTNATIADNQGIATITDNDPIPTLTFANVTVIEPDVGHRDRDVHRHPFRSERQDRDRGLRHGQRHRDLPGRLLGDLGHVHLQPRSDHQDDRCRGPRGSAERGERDVHGDAHEPHQRHDPRRHAHRHHHRQRPLALGRDQ